MEQSDLPASLHNEHNNIDMLRGMLYAREQEFIMIHTQLQQHIHAQSQMIERLERTISASLDRVSRRIDRIESIFRNEDVPRRFSKRSSSKYRSRWSCRHWDFDTGQLPKHLCPKERNNNRQSDEHKTRHHKKSLTERRPVDQWPKLYIPETLSETQWIAEHRKQARKCPHKWSLPRHGLHNEKQRHDSHVKPENLSHLLRRIVTNALWRHKGHSLKMKCRVAFRWLKKTDRTGLTICIKLN